MSLKKDLTKVFSANFLQFLIGLVNSFFVPAFLGLDQYAYLKTFTLYLSYVGIFHFGFIDGIYIKYGGKQKNTINVLELNHEYKFLLTFQSFVTLIFFLVGLIKKDIILLAFSLSIIPVNMQTFFSFLFQALGELSLYSQIKILFPILTLFLNLFVIFVLKINNYIPFVISYLIAYYISFLFFEFEYIKLLNTKNVGIDRNINEIKKLFSIGIFVMLGNLSTMFVYSLDRWFVKFLLTVEDFAYYSFAVSMMSIINLLISATATVFYPYLARGYTKELIKELKKYLLIIGAISSFGYFALSFVVKIFLKKYNPSLSVISILFAGFPAISVINVLYVNLYKIDRKERKYFKTVLLMVIISFVLNLIAVLINKSNQSIALATTISFYIWFFWSSKDFNGLGANKKEILFLSLYLPLFFISTLYLDLLSGSVLFGLGVSLLLFIFYKNEIISLLKIILKNNPN